MKIFWISFLFAFQLNKSLTLFIFIYDEWEQSIFRQALTFVCEKDIEWCCWFCVITRPIIEHSSEDAASYMYIRIYIDVWISLFRNLYMLFSVLVGSFLLLQMCGRRMNIKRSLFPFLLINIVIEQKNAQSSFFVFRIILVLCTILLFSRWYNGKRQRK